MGFYVPQVTEGTTMKNCLKVGQTPKVKLRNPLFKLRDFIVILISTLTEMLE